MPTDRTTFERRFWNKVEVGHPCGCWWWTGAKSRDGYARTYRPTGSRYAHRVAYELLMGPIPTGLELDHLCRNRGCVNPDHMEPVTHVENVRRGTLGSVARLSAAAIDHCPHGHPYNEKNTYIKRPHNGRRYTHRHCRVCLAAQARERRARKAA